MGLSIASPRCLVRGACLLATLAALPRPADGQELLRIILPPAAAPRIRHGADCLRTVIERNGQPVRIVEAESSDATSGIIRLGKAADGAVFGEALKGIQGQQEGFAIRVPSDGTTVVAGCDDSGVFYGCLELADRMTALGGRLPKGLTFQDAPRLRVRGPCLGLQRPETGSDGVQYIFRYLPETFPWLYDRALWTRFLDLLARYRFNTLYLWNGHPFTSILRLPKYPEAQEVETRQLEANIELFKWLCVEADRRGIWVVQNFYNIHLSHAFARHHHIAKVHSKPTPLISEYTAYCISEFIRNYPNVGLMMCLGEALNDTHDAQWLTEVVIPAVRSALAPGQPPPPIIVRSHSTPIFDVLAKAQPLYSNIYVEAKYNNETLASDRVGGGTDPTVTRHYPWEAGGGGHQRLAKRGLLVTNVHCVANLEPFRWGSPDFVRRAMTNCVETGVKGLHLYPLRYWEWPYSADRASPRLLQADRDWIWYAVWARYAWNPHRDRSQENAFWVGELKQRYGSPEAATRILAAYERSGEVMPHIVRAFAVTTENYQATTMGMTLPQLFKSKRWYAPYPGETIAEYARRESVHLTHTGETPPQAAQAIVRDADAAVVEAEAAAPMVRQCGEEYRRFVDDMRAIRRVARHYAAKVDAAIAGWVYLETRDEACLRRCRESLERSVDEYRLLARLTTKTYLDCAGRHDSGRRYPYPAPKYLVWSDMLPEFEKELAAVRRDAGVLRTYRDGPEPVR